MWTLNLQILKFHPDNPKYGETLSKSIAHLREAGLVAMPTETVYGLAADATSGVAVAKIFEVKKRPQFNPLIAHVSSLEMARAYGVFDAVSTKLAEHFWPGPLTLVVNKSSGSNIHDLVSAGLDTIAIRCPGGSARQMIEAFGRPLAAPSANLSGKVSATTVCHVAIEFAGEDILVLDGGACNVGIESTIARVMDGKIKVLRTGSVTEKQLAEYSGLPVETEETGAEIRAPGMLTSHYAPRSNVIINCNAALAGAAILDFGSQNTSGDYQFQSYRDLSPNGDLREAAANLYNYLRELDELGRDDICVAAIPMEGLGIAINDRLVRAAAPRSRLTDNMAIAPISEKIIDATTSGDGE
ncbi:MAG: threonylcarbamoyl-AMP synthase [Gammaproteobacteria bacterium]|nr:threonylcarbamoyl-AMP synthase [Gammaproteobacteria bacterium]